MTSVLRLPGIQMDGVPLTCHSPSFRPKTFPPAEDFPVVINARGEVTSAYGDSNWDLSPWAGRSCNIPFGDFGESPSVSPENARLLRLIAGWWLWGPFAARTPKHLQFRVSQLRQLAKICSKEGILLSDLSRFPRVVDSAATLIPSSYAAPLIGQLQRLLAHRTELGFVILDQAGINRLASSVASHESIQTPYIPQRIWTYQVLRLRELLDEYLDHRDAIAECFSFCLEAYRQNAGDWAALFAGRLSDVNRPFNAKYRAGQSIEHRRFHGHFRETAARFGIDDLVLRWTGDETICGLSELLSMVREAGMAYTMNFTLMRVDEAVQMRAGCYSVERDDLNEDVHLIASKTSKTLHDADARWICSPSVSVAIEAMTHVARLRQTAAINNPFRTLNREDLDRPMLWSLREEPWSKANEAKGERGTIQNYSKVLTRRPLLFDEDQIRITQADLELGLF
jgi:hypothetical protein